MNTSDIVAAVAANAANGVTKAQAKTIVDNLLGTLSAALVTNGEVHLQGIGKLVTKHTPARMGRNPATGQEVPIKAGRKVAFSMSKVLKDALNGTI